MLHDATIVVFSSIDWTFNRQNPQEVAAAFADAGNRVLFVENTGVRRPAWRDRRRLWYRLANWCGSRVAPRRTSAGVDVCSPLLVPLPYSRFACRINTAVLLRVIRRWAGSRADDLFVVITFLPTPLVRGVIRGLAPDLTVYYVIDRLAESSAGARSLRSHEEALLAEVDLVFTTSHGLLEYVSRVTSRGSLLTSGVRFQEFQHARERPADPPPRVRGLRRPVVGFLGSVRNEVDLGLLGRVVRSAPDLTFLFVGPVVADVRRFAGCHNVRFVGAVPHEEVIGYVTMFDVGIIPYVHNPFTAHILPFKLKEYLAAGLPVVATGLPEIHRFVSEHGDVIAIADDAPSFVSAVRSAMANDAPADRMRRANVAKHYDWSDRINVMCRRMEGALAARRANREPRRYA